MIFTWEFLKSFLYQFAWWAALSALFGVAEYLWPAREQAAIRNRLQNLLIVAGCSLLLALMGQVLIRIPNALLARGLLGMVFGRWHSNSIAGILGTTLVYALVWDFFQYWWHRAEHGVTALWPVHALHHVEERVNSTTSLRNTVWSGVGGFFAVHLPTLMICGVNLLTVYGATVLFTMWGFFNHANLRLNLRWATPIISGPQWHRLHHGREREYYDKNFAAFFPFLDLLFGTYRHPKKDEFPETGLADRRQGQLGMVSIVGDILGVPTGERRKLASEKADPAEAVEAPAATEVLEAEEPVTAAHI